MPHGKVYTFSPRLAPVYYLCTLMIKPKEDYSFWTKYKKFAGNEILLYVIMVVGIILGIMLFS